jgi:Spy/CpxP family protein refolding chaperone
VVTFSVAQQIGYGEKEKSKMKRTFGILFAVTLMVVMTGNLFAQEMMGMMEKTGKEAEAGAKKMMSGAGMMSGGMMQGMMSDKGMMEDGMMCPMCKKMMGGKGMMSGGMMQGMMSDKGMMVDGMMCPMCGKMMGGKGMMGGKAHIAAMAEVLKLSEEQQDKLNALHIAHRKDAIRKKADKEIAEIDLQVLIDQDEVDLDAVEGKLKEIADLEVQTKYASIKLLVDSKSLLTAEQKLELKKLMKGKKCSMMGQMMGGKEAKADKSAPKTESGEHEEHH